MSLSDYVKSWINRHPAEYTKGDGTPLYQCPRCLGHRKLEVSRTGKWFCHKCGVGGGFQERGQNYPQGRGDFFREDHSQDYRALIPGNSGDDGLLAYLREDRCLSELQIRELCPCAGPMEFYVYFPLFKLGSNTPSSYIGRCIIDAPGYPRYVVPSLSAFLTRKNHLLWGLHRSGFYRGKSLVLVEGVFDAVWEPNRLALLGKRISPEQIDVVNRLSFEEITVMLDGDAQKEAMTICQTLSSESTKRRIYRVRLPYGFDPDQLRTGPVFKRLWKRRERIH